MEIKEKREKITVTESSPPLLRLALPDGHQQQPAIEFLKKAGIEVWNYTSKSRRPDISIEGVKLKMIRPQDMPLQVANDNFDLAITGQDWLCDHLYRFPSSPVREILNLDFGKVRIVAVVHSSLTPESPKDLRELLKKGEIPNLRIASEYINIADSYARDNRLSPYRLIPTWGASEVFLPEDADLLIENVQTGQTLARHKLKVIDTLFSTSACLIGNVIACDSRSRQNKANEIINIMRRALEAK